MQKAKENVVFFSSGESEKKGILKELKKALDSEINCCDWHELFADAKHSDMIALLPMLMKKIPTFDFAVMICEGHDTTEILRDGKKVFVKTMRDNVLFEIGLAIMALGVTRVIIIRDDEVRLPEDLVGKAGETSTFCVSLSKDIESISDEILKYISNHSNDYSPIVVGAAASTAMGYLQNFVIRTYENWNGKVRVNDADTINISKENLRFEIYVPSTHEENANDYNDAFMKLYSGYICKEGDTRGINFRFYMNDDKMVIVDIPTSLKTSYTTADVILHLDADDDFDDFAEKRFVNKELRLFYKTLKRLLCKDSLKKICKKLDDETIEMCVEAVKIVQGEFTLK